MIQTRVKPHFEVNVRAPPCWPLAMNFNEEPVRSKSIVVLSNEISGGCSKIRRNMIYNVHLRLVIGLQILFIWGPGLTNQWVPNKVVWPAPLPKQPAPHPSLFKNNPLIKIPNPPRSCQSKFLLWVVLKIQNYRSSQTSCFCLISLCNKKTIPQIGYRTGA